MTLSGDTIGTYNMIITDKITKLQTNLTIYVKEALFIKYKDAELQNGQEFITNLNYQLPIVNGSGDYNLIVADAIYHISDDTIFIKYISTDTDKITLYDNKINDYVTYKIKVTDNLVLVDNGEIITNGWSVATNQNYSYQIVNGSGEYTMECNASECEYEIVGDNLIIKFIKNGTFGIKLNDALTGDSYSVTFNSYNEIFVSKKGHKISTMKVGYTEENVFYIHNGSGNYTFTYNETFIKLTADGAKLTIEALTSFTKDDETLEARDNQTFTIYDNDTEVTLTYKIDFYHNFEIWYKQKNLTGGVFDVQQYMGYDLTIFDNYENYTYYPTFLGDTDKFVIKTYHSQYSWNSATCMIIPLTNENIKVTARHSASYMTKSFIMNSSYNTGYIKSKTNHVLNLFGYPTSLLGHFFIKDIYKPTLSYKKMYNMTASWSMSFKYRGVDNHSVGATHVVMPIGVDLSNYKKKILHEVRYPEAGVKKIAFYDTNDYRNSGYTNGVTMTYNKETQTYDIIFDPSVFTDLENNPIECNLQNYYANYEHKTFVPSYDNLCLTTLSYGGISSSSGNFNGSSYILLPIKTSKWFGQTNWNGNIRQNYHQNYFKPLYYRTGQHNHNKSGQIFYSNSQFYFTICTWPGETANIEYITKTFKKIMLCNGEKTLTYTLDEFQKLADQETMLFKDSNGWGLTIKNDIFTFTENRNYIEKECFMLKTTIFYQDIDIIIDPIDPLSVELYGDTTDMNLVNSNRYMIEIDITNYDIGDVIIDGTTYDLSDLPKDVTFKTYNYTYTSISGQTLYWIIFRDDITHDVKIQMKAKS